MSKFDYHYGKGKNYSLRKAKDGIIRKCLNYSVTRAILFKIARKNKRKAFLKDLSELDEAEVITIDFPKGVDKPIVGLINEYLEVEPFPKTGELPYSYWLKFERFLKNNEIQYDMLNPHTSDFLDKAGNYDIIVWRVGCNPEKLDEGKTKIRILEQQKNKTCYPTYDELWSYEHKVRQYYLLKEKNLPVVDTFISFSLSETKEYIKNAKYPFVSKISTGSSSFGVKLIKNKKQAWKEVKKIFYSGRKTYWNYVYQKGYVYFQKYIPNAEYDLRMTVVGNSYFGFYKYVPKNDFRASGGMNIVKKELPETALYLAKEVKEAFPNSKQLVIDLLWNEEKSSFEIIEMSIFVLILTYEQLKVNNISGRYFFENGAFEFEEGKFWLQELVLKEVISEWINKIN